MTLGPNGMPFISFYLCDRFIQRESRRGFTALSALLIRGARVAVLAAWCYPTVLQIGDSRSLLTMSWAAKSASLIRNGQGQ